MTSLNELPGHFRKSNDPTLRSALPPLSDIARLTAQVRKVPKAEILAIMRRTMRSYAWIGTTGGPHLLLADEQLPYWRGIDQWRDCEKYPTNQSDYARACSVTTWLGSIPCHRGSAVVLSGDAGDIAWYTDGEDDRGFLVQRIGVDNERLIEPALHTPQLRDLLKSSGAECLHLETGASGTMWLMDASDRGSDLRSVRQALALRPGVYLARAAYYSAAGLMIVVREICWIKPLPTKVS